MNKKIWIPLLVVILIVVAVGFIWKAKSPSNNQLTKITFPISWFHGAQYGYVYVAKEKGYFADEGLDVTITENKGSAITSKLIASGEYPIGMVGADVAAISIDKGMPITLVAVTDKVSPGGVTCHKSAGVSKPTDLYGKKIGVTITSNAYQQWLVFLKIANLDTKKINEVPIGGAGAEFLAKQVDCFALYPFLTEANAKVKGLEVNSLTYYDFGEKMYNQTIGVNSDYLKNHADIVQKITRAIMKGVKFERENPEETINIVLRQNPGKERVYETAVLAGRLLLDKKLPSNISAFDGVMTDMDWKEVVSILLDSKLLEKDLPTNSLYTNKFLQ